MNNNTPDIRVRGPYPEAPVMATKTLTVKQRKSIFHALVETQDQGASVSESKRKVAAKYHLSHEQLELIEKEGLDKDWPPLT